MIAVLAGLSLYVCREACEKWSNERRREKNPPSALFSSLRSFRKAPGKGAKTQEDPSPLFPPQPHTHAIRFLFAPPPRFLGSPTPHFPVPASYYPRSLMLPTRWGRSRETYREDEIEGRSGKILVTQSPKNVPLIRILRTIIRGRSTGKSCVRISAYSQSISSIQRKEKRWKRVRKLPLPWPSLPAGHISERKKRRFPLVTQQHLRRSSSSFFLSV